MKIQVAYLSYDNSDQTLLKRSDEILNEFFGDGNYTFDSNQGRVIFIASGGSERKSIDITKDEKNVIILCHRESNSYAAAVEIAAYLRAHNKRVVLIDVMAEKSMEEFQDSKMAFSALDSLAKQRAAVIGEISEWLIISDIDDNTIKNKLGIEVLRLPWKNFESYKEIEPSEEFLKFFNDFNTDELLETARVYSLLNKIAEDNNLSAMSVECFSMVMRDKVTACLPLAAFNAKNIVAACEGDVCSMIGSMLIRSIANEIPWQANIAEIKEDSVLLAHCTAPLHMLSSFDITTHYETDCGTAIKGVIDYQQVGVFRIDSKLEKYMLLVGEIIDTPNHNYACRTQIEFHTGSKETNLLKYHGLGNHHLVFPLVYSGRLEKLMQFLEISKIE